MDFLADGHGNILLVGDGDFSLSVALSKYPEFQAHNTTSSSLETETSISVHAQAMQNMNLLKEMGVSVYLETDAREIHTHEAISKKRYDRIIFNFPLSDRHNIKKNRALLADFFLSCGPILSPGGRVMVTLSKGQGGTPADQPVRSWHNSWQIVAMATNAGFLLQSVTPFDSALFPEYHSVGFRFQDKSFDTSGGLIHAFEMAELVKETDFGLRGSVTFNNASYSCSRYIANKMKRDLLTEPHNPAAILKTHLESSLNVSFPNCLPAPCLPPLLPGLRSLAHIVQESEQLGDATPTHGKGRDGEGSDKTEKERKNRETYDKLHRPSFAHGVEGNAVLNADSGSHQSVLPTNDECVSILIRTSNDTVVSPGPNGDGCRDVTKGESASEVEQETLATSDAVQQSSPVYHHRVSLLENTPQLCDELVSHCPGCLSKKECAPISSALATSYNSSTLSNGKLNETMPPISEDSAHGLGNCNDKVNDNLRSKVMHSSPCFVVSGQCILPGPIHQNFVPVRHELMVIQLIPEMSSISPKTVAANFDMKYVEHISAQIVSALQKLRLVSGRNTFSLQPCNSMKIGMQGIDECFAVNEITFQGQVSDDLDIKDALSIGKMFCARKRNLWFHITLFNITDFSCQLWGIEDKRLLWCTQEKFLNQFQSSSGSDVPSSLFKPLCIYPMKFAHDISFWENDDDFDPSAFYEIIRNIADDLVFEVTLTDLYVDPVTNRKSRCYRLHFESRSQALPYFTSWKLQSLIRLEVSKALGVTLR